MTLEPFLVNPKRKRRILQRKKRRIFRGNPFGETLMVVGNRKRIKRRKKTKRVSLFNFPREVKRMRTRVKRRKRHNPRLPKGLLSKMMRKYGPRQGMKKAWSQFKGKGGIKRMARRKTTSRRRRRHLPIVAHGKRVVHRRHRVTVYGNPPVRHRRRHRRRNPRTWYRSRFSRSRASGIHINRRHRRRHNPRRSFGGASLPAVSFRRPMSILMPAAVGVGAYMACEMVPSKLGMTDNLSRLGVKAAVGVGGSIAVGKFLGRANGTVWLIVSAVDILQDILKTYVFTSLGISLSGLSAFPGGQSYGAYPYQSYTDWYNQGTYDEY